MKNLCLAAAALLTPTPSVAQAAPDQASSGRPVSVIGAAEIDTVEPPATFDFRVQASGDGRTGSGVIFLTHHDDARISWAVARVDCVRRSGRDVVVTGVVGDAQDFAVAGPGDRVSVSVRDGSPDRLGFGSRDQVTRCRGPLPDRAVDRGDFRIGPAAAGWR
jgi:hypothetical protein